MATSKTTAKPKTTTKRATTSRSTAAKKTTRSSTKAAIKKPKAAAKPAVAAPVETAGDAGTLNKKEFIDRVMTEAGMKKGEARAAVDAVMVAMNGALREGKSVNIAPLGKMRFVKSKDTPNGKLAVLRVKLKEPMGGGDKDPLAKAAE